MAEGKPKSPESPNEQLTDSDTSEEEQVHLRHKTPEEKRHHRTIPGLALAIQIVLSHSRAQANPAVERGPSRNVRIKKLQKDKAEDKSMQTPKKET